MMRQWIAMAFLLLALQLLIEKKWGFSALLMVVSVFFHYQISSLYCAKADSSDMRVGRMESEKSNSFSPRRYFSSS